MTHRGPIPGPCEDEEAYQELKPSCSPCKAALDHVETLFGLRPDWIEVSFSNRGLLPWQGGVTEIDKGVRIQVRKRFQTHSRLYGLYTREEILAHEMVHGMRMGFDESRFEEILAYRTSPSLFRRYFGPLFRSSWESSLFLLSSLFVFWVPWVPMLIGGGFLFRLIRAQRTFNRCLKRLQAFAGDSALGCMLYLTDREIVLFSKMESGEIKEYAQKQTTLRWQHFLRAYTIYRK